MRDTSVLAIFHQIANAKAEFANLRANMSEATAQRRLRVAGFQRALGPLARFLGSFFGARQRMNIKVGTARRAARRSRGGLYARGEENPLKI